MKKITLIFLFFLSFLACTNNEKLIEIVDKDTTLSKPNNDYMVLATNWYQQSAEMRALYYQSYNLAKAMILLNKKQVKQGKKPAVVLDIDETVLNNSPFEAKAIQTGINYTSETWKEWTDLAKAEALPGALDFINFAKQQGVEVFYISNRKSSELTTTIKNLSDKGFPNADSSFILLRTETSDKTARRDQVSQNYEIILLVGDNLTDFSEVFAKRGDDMGFAVVDKYKEDFGIKFIVLPNPMYGEWESAIYKNSHNWSETQKDSLRKSKLIIGY